MNDGLIVATVACFLNTLTIVVVCIWLQCSGSLKVVPETDEKGFFSNISVYVSGNQFEHVKLALFYSVIGVTFHSVYALHIIIKPDPVGGKWRWQREMSKALACVFLSMFVYWMSHRNRKLRQWRPLHIMVGMTATMLFLDLAEECASYGDDEYEWVIYVFPLAIDFKMYVLIHTWSNLTSAKTDYLIEQDRYYRQLARQVDLSAVEPLRSQQGGYEELSGRHEEDLSQVETRDGGEPRRESYETFNEREQVKEQQGRNSREHRRESTA
ncbi:uncharacterized protein LOC116619087 [Nematostella vectensis]|uniref:uncharacterized protein LOC116619087 n=1 Tax=Nematostella vectensis TaxID=45351 RepID=UPI00207708D9|nr:uncharacterized protein LOC116619087 [Nematostella vectensis]